MAVWLICSSVVLLVLVATIVHFIAVQARKDGDDLLTALRGMAMAALRKMRGGQL